MGLDLQRLSDRLEINDLLHRYAHAVDRKDWDLYAQCFTADAHIDYSSSGGVAGPFPDVAAWIAKTMEIFSMTQHFVTNSLVTIDGDHATGRAYFYNPMILAGQDRGVQYMIVGGYYNDRYMRTADGWRIAERIEESAFMDGPFTRA
jgi:hypothetical protein